MEETIEQVQVERKCFAIKAADAELQENRFRGAPAVMGNIDHGGDVIFPGAFKGAIERFLKNGFIPIGHDWFDLPVAMPVSAHEDGMKLWAEAEFHSTPRAQEAKTVMQERLARGMDVGLSIGFDIAPDGSFQFDCGEKMLEYAEGNDHDTAGFDTKSIKAYKRPCRAITKVGNLFEYSIVSVPMNPLAVATAAKGVRFFNPSDIATERDIEELLRDAGFSAKDAKALMSSYKTILLARDAGAEQKAEEEQSETPAPEPSGPITLPTKPAAKRYIVFSAAGELYR